VSGKVESNKKNKTNKAWITEHVNDAYVQRARAEGWRSRAAFKLTEIDDKDRLLKPGMTVVDLGSAPGSWSQVAARRVAPGGRLIALDLLPMDALHRGCASSRETFATTLCCMSWQRHWKVARLTLYCRTWPPICRALPSSIRRG